MIFSTTIQAIDPKDGELKKWVGQNITALNFAHAESKIQNQGLGYLKIEGILIAEEDTEERTTNYENLN